jgi:hypothetical protein
MTSAINLSLQQTAPDLIDALYQARRENRIDLRGKVERLLDHPEPTVREEAVALLLSRWRIAIFGLKRVESLWVILIPAFGHEPPLDLRRCQTAAIASLTQGYS